jgi:periplasmic iron binding protein
MLSKMRLTAAALGLALALGTGGAIAAGRTIGQPIEHNELVLVVRYIQAVTMDGMEGMDHSAHAGHGGAPGDAHLEAVVYASKNSKNGFQPGEWVPYLDIRYEAAKDGSAWKGTGQLIPMLASDGPHYGTNLQLDGPGKYHLKLKVAPPSPAVFPRHTDKETGAAEWWPPFTEEFDFTFVGSVGKKGGY